MTEEPIAEYRRKAEECRQQAQLSIRSEDKAHWLRLATDWQMLAEGAEKIQGQGTIRMVRNRDA